MKICSIILLAAIGFFSFTEHSICREKELNKDAVKQKLLKGESDFADMFKDQVIEDWIDGQWVISGKTIVTETGGNVTAVLNEAWENGAVIYASRWIFNYNASNQITEWITETDEDGSGNFVYNTKEIINYFGSTNTSTLSQEWAGSWIDYSRDTYTYENGKMTEILTEEFVGNNWVNAYHTSYTYEGDNMTEQLWQDWNGSEWINSTKFTSVYDNQNRETEYKMESWDGANWITLSTTVYSYDSNGDLSIEEYISEIIPGFAMKEKTVYTYENHLPVLEENYDWDFMMNDYYTNVSSEVSHTYNNGELYQTLTKAWDMISSQLVNEERITYTELTDTDELDSELPEYFEIKNYPNPFNPCTTIEFTLPEYQAVTINIFNIKGELVDCLISNKVYGAGVQKVNWNGKNMKGQFLSTGVYLIKITSEKFNKTHRILLLK